jgi:hydroxymethylbilane synthase
MKEIRIGTRGSQLALWQARFVSQKLEMLGHKTTLCVIKTQGDQDQKTRIDEMGGKGVFVRQIEEALEKHQVDLGVHSLKDLPWQTPEGLELFAFLTRHDPRDQLIFSKDPGGLEGELTKEHIQNLPPGLVFGSGSLRRSMLLHHTHPGLRTLSIRGNIDTRLEKLKSNPELQGIFLARAGLERLELLPQGYPLDPSWFVPSPGQGILTVEGRSGDLELKAILGALDDPDSRRAASWEREIVGFLGADCRLPLGVYAFQKVPDHWKLWIFIASKDRTLRFQFDWDPEIPEAHFLATVQLTLKEARAQELLL